MAQLLKTVTILPPFNASPDCSKICLDQSEIMNRHHINLVFPNFVKHIVIGDDRQTLALETIGWHKMLLNIEITELPVGSDFLVFLKNNATLL